MKQTFDKLCDLIGKERNYGPTPEEKAELERIAQEEKVGGHLLPQYETLNLIITDEKGSPRMGYQGKNGTRRERTSCTEGGRMGM